MSRRRRAHRQAPLTAREALLYSLAVHWAVCELLAKVGL
jgi:hypothetical protein